ncbi:hypothetical protein WA026_009500 [Henosepilachna vigintioctopunctata]|uniref:Uncharacterized protein n=1 Tax=Henosepilachna vigintioctopunctata TaxID=420089 RepID=A0AAW1U4X4_9CUCU
MEYLFLIDCVKFRNPGVFFEINSGFSESGILETRAPGLRPPVGIDIFASVAKNSSDLAQHRRDNTTPSPRTGPTTNGPAAGAVAERTTGAAGQFNCESGRERIHAVRLRRNTRSSTMPVVPPVLVTFLVAALGRAAGADGPTQPPCPVLEHVCRCSSDLQEFQCKAAAFEEVPQNLPYTITKL